MAELSLSTKKDIKKLKNKEITKPNFWTEEEDRILKEKAEEYKYKNWNLIANFIPGRTSIQCSARYRRIRPGLIKGAWDKEEDNKLLSLYEKYGKNWAAISKEMPHRTGKQIRDRFLNSLDSKFERGKFTEEEDQAIIKYYKNYGNSWAKIAKKLKTRTGDMVKNRFYSSLKKTIFKSKTLLKRKRERNSTQTKQTKIEEKINNYELNNKTNSKEKKTKNIICKEKVEKKEKKEVSKFIEDIKESSKEKGQINNKKKKHITNSTNNNSYDSNNNSLDIENKNNNNHIIIKNNTINSSEELNENLNNSKQTLNNDDKIENDNNNADFNLEENTKKTEIPNYSDFNCNFRINADLFNGLNDNVNNNDISLNQKDEVDERLEKLKSFSKLELEYKQSLKEQLDIIYDLENIINQKLYSIQKEIENN